MPAMSHAERGRGSRKLYSKYYEIFSYDFDCQNCQGLAVPSLSCDTAGETADRRDHFEKFLKPWRSLQGAVQANLTSEWEQMNEVGYKFKAKYRNRGTHQ